MSKPTAKKVEAAVDTLYAIGVELDPVQKRLVNDACVQRSRDESRTCEAGTPSCCIIHNSAPFDMSCESF